ncbi:MAG: hypothetical protein ACUVWJ_01150 [Spirochaetota bacterium]
MSIRRGVVPLIYIAAIILCAHAYADVYYSDINRDGKIDGWTYVNGGRVEKQEIDMNYDGKVNAIFIYDVYGKVCEEILDTDFDGRMDNWRTYSKGSLILESLDSNKDGKPDIWFHIDRGRVYMIEKDTTGDGKPDRIISY